jgi:transcription initiation factor IIE alpha subunit
MPSTLDIIEPAEFTLKDVELTNLLNDLQAHLHRVDMVAKQVKVENDVYKNNLGSLLHNYVKVLLTKGDLSAEQLSKLTGVTKEQLEDFLDKMIDKGVIDLKKGMYTLKKKEE